MRKPARTIKLRSRFSKNPAVSWTGRVFSFWEESVALSCPNMLGLEPMVRLPQFSLIVVCVLSVWMAGKAQEKKKSTPVPVKWEVLQKTLQQHSKTAMSSCVGIRTESKRQGSGVLISRSGLLLTAAHLFADGKEKFEVYCPDQIFRQGEVLRMSADLDVALVQVKGLVVPEVTVARFQSANAPRAEGSVLPFIASGHASGYRFGPRPPVRIGFGFERPDDGILETSCRITAGDSGGPLFNLQGELCGIHRSMDSGGEFASHVSIEQILSIWPELRELQ